MPGPLLDQAASAVEARRVEEGRLLPRLSRPAVAGVVMLLLVALAWPVLRSPASGSGADGLGPGSSARSAAACAAFRDYRSRSLAGSAASSEAVVSAAASASAGADIRDAAQRLHAAAMAGDADGVLAASSALTELCHP